MTERPNTQLDDSIDALADNFARGLSELAGQPMVRAALIAPALGCLVVSLENEFPDCLDVIADELRKQADIARDEERARLSDGGSA